jgi:Lrp/AsnC family transcriptional regulator, leucine-responsive regulatory protein
LVNLDIKDRKLLYYLSLNARQSHTQLSRKVGLSKNGVKYRIERLKKEGVIKGFTIIPNIGSCGYDTFDILLKFNEDIYENEEIINYFKNHGLCINILALSGGWDLFVEIIVPNLSRMAAIVRDITSHFGEVLNKYKVFYVASAPVKLGDALEDLYVDLNLEKPKPKRLIEKKQKLDIVDKKIMMILAKDSSLPLMSIARELNTTLDIVRYRMKRLANSGLIFKFDTNISLSVLGYTKYLCRISLRGGSEERINAIKKRISVDKDIIYAFFDVNGYNIVFSCAFKDAENLDHLLRGLRKDFSDIIEDQEYLLIKEEVLLNLFPKGLLEE